MTRWFWLSATLIALVAPGSATAQAPRDAAVEPGPAALQEQKEQNQDLPIQIELATLEVRDKSKMATFSGDVQVVQGDTTIKCDTLVVFYGAGGPGAGPLASAVTHSAREPRGMPRGRARPCRRELRISAA